jgi:Ca2+-transporting ATPase
MMSWHNKRRAVFKIPLLANPLLVAGVVGSQALHIVAMQVPLISGTLSLQPVAPAEWAMLIAAAASILVVMELDKAWVRRRARVARVAA